MPLDLKKDPVFAHVPRLKAEDWDDAGIFRETYLSELSDEQAVGVLRDFGILQLIFMREALTSWPFRAIDSTVHRLRAAAADLRHLQGFVGAFCERPHEDRKTDMEQGGEVLAAQGDRFCDLGRRISEAIAALADEIEGETSGWEFKVPDASVGLDLLDPGENA